VVATPLKRGALNNMRDVFKEIVNMDGVSGVLLLSHEGTVLFESFSASFPPPPEKHDWLQLVSALDGAREVDIVFHDARIYVRRSEIGYLLVLISPFVSVAMLRLNCDILLPSLKSKPEVKGIKRFFKKK
jgi:hypothetical protein